MNPEEKKVKIDNIINDERQEKKKKRRLLILIILMFLISFISYFLGYILGKIDVIPTSGKSRPITNNTVENSIVENNTNSNYPNYNYNYEYNANNNTNENVNENNNPNTNNTEENENNIKKTDTIKITENNIEWEVTEKVNVFSNPQYSYKSIVAPNSEGYYQFIVENTTANSIKYNINFTEINENDINLKYKLKLDNIYIVGNKDKWVDVSELNLTDVILANTSKNLYVLQWKWIETTDEQDTLAAGKGYEMLINLNAAEL